MGICGSGNIYFDQKMGAFLEQPIVEKKIEKYQHKKLRACTLEMQGMPGVLP